MSVHSIANSRSARRFGGLAAVLALAAMTAVSAAPGRSAGADPVHPATVYADFIWPGAPAPGVTGSAV